MGFYPLAFAALFLMARTRVRRLTLATWLDCFVTGLTAAAFAAAIALGALLRTADGGFAVVATSVAYPAADLLLLSLLAGALVVIGRGAGAGWWWLVGGVALFVVTDTVYAFQVVHGTYTVGGPLDMAWGLAFVCLGLAACQPHARGDGQPAGGSRCARRPCRVCPRGARAPLRRLPRQRRPDRRGAGPVRRPRRARPHGPDLP